MGDGNTSPRSATVFAQEANYRTQVVGESLSILQTKDRENNAKPTKRRTDNTNMNSKTSKTNNGNVENPRSRNRPAGRDLRGIILVGALVAVALTCHAAYDCWVLTNGNCAQLQGACSVGGASGNITASSTMGICDGGSPGNRECSGDTNSMVPCGYQCTYKDTDGFHSKWQTNSIAKPTLKGDGC